jgi:hypothetical protein
MTNGARINRYGFSYSDDKKGDPNRSCERYSYIHCFPLTRDRKAEVEKCNEERKLYQKINGKIQSFKHKYSRNQYKLDSLPLDKKQQVISLLDQFVHDLDRITGT